MNLACAGQLQAGPEHAGAADAVHVVIAVDHDRPVLPDGPDDPLGRLHDSRQGLGVVQAAQLGLEERDGPLGLLDPAVDQQLGHQRRDPRTPRECQDLIRIKGLQPPPRRHSRPSSRGFADHPANDRRSHRAIPMIKEIRFQGKGGACRRRKRSPLGGFTHHA